MWNRLEGTSVVLTCITGRFDVTLADTETSPFSSEKPKTEKTKMSVISAVKVLSDTGMEVQKLG